MKFADLVREYSTTTGLGAIALSGAVNGFNPFSAAGLNPGDQFYYSIINLDKPLEKEAGVGTWQADGTFTRAPTGAPTSFTSGTKTVALVVGAAWFGDTEAAINTVGGDIAAEAAARVAADNALAATNAALDAELDTKEPNIAPGAANQYWRGDKSWQALDKAAVGLANVDNTSDANKPISTAAQAALDGKEPTIAPSGDPDEYYAGDKTFRPLPVGGGGGSPSSDIGLYTAASGISISATLTLVRTSGYAVAGDGGGARFAFSASEPAVGPKFQDASGRWFGLAERSPSSLMFGVGLAGVSAADNTTRLQEFFTYINTIACDRPTVDGEFTIGGGAAAVCVSLTLDQTKTSQLDWRARITGTGTYDILLDIASTGRNNTINGIIWLRGNSTTYTARTIQHAVRLNGAARLKVTGGFNLANFRHSGITGNTAANNNLASLGAVFVSHCGSGGALSADHRLTANWSGRVDTGGDNNTNQRTTITVDALPDTYSEAHVAPKMVLINGRAHYIYSIDRPGSTITIHPWPDPAIGSSGTLIYLLGAGVTLDGSDNNVVGMDLLDASDSGNGIISNGLYGPQINRMHVNGCSNGVVLGGTPSDQHVAASIAQYYWESNCTLAVIKLTDVTPGLNIYSSQGLTPDKFDVPAAPWDTSINERSRTNNHMESMLYRDDYGIHQFLRRPDAGPTAGSYGSSYGYRLDRPGQRYQEFRRDTWTIALQTPNASLRRMFGYDGGQLTFVGTGALGQPTGSFTFDPPAGHSINGGAVDANAVFSNFTGPVTFAVFYDGGTGWTVFPIAGSRTVPEFTTIELGHATDTTLSRPSAGNLAVEGNLVYRQAGTDVAVSDGGTGASTPAGARTNLELKTGATTAIHVGTSAPGSPAEGDLWVDTN